MSADKTSLKNENQPSCLGAVISRFSNYKKSVMERAWKDFKIKKRHREYEDWTFANSLYWAHRHISALKRNGL